ncbi:sushi, von Willebrand factor type A, EGF and pentraxin domain-containing protein 1-like [Branchiostoma lanceolatum]|uniref:sushi, von Willebrand factor type A, EGF and pentraxin domain-containing protein 1-like n=1 Tax=Branchiostoma lanceolatum TaxID=7740 RepID=UPI00345450C1
MWTYAFLLITAVVIWPSSSQDVNQGTCGPPITHFAWPNCFPPYYHGTVCTFRCWSGYVPASFFTSSTCLPNGVWSGGAFICQPIIGK